MFSVGSFNVKLPEYLLSFSEMEMCKEEALNLILWKQDRLSQLQSCWDW